MTPNLSIVIPIKDEQENIETLAREISIAMDSTAWKWEVVWMNDGSTDSSANILELVTANDSRHKHVTLMPGRGQAAALVEGFKVAQADILATLDGDGQNDPADIPRMLEHLLKTKADMVNGRRFSRRDGIQRKIVSGFGNIFRNAITGEKLNDVGCAIRVFHRRCIKDLSIQKELRGMHRFFPTISRLNGCRRLEELSVNHRSRQLGTSKYTTLGRFPDFMRDAWVIARKLSALPKNSTPVRQSSSDRRRA